MRPGADERPVLRAGPGSRGSRRHPLVDAEGRPGIRVVPAALLKGRRRDASVLVRDSEAPPVLVARRVLQPLPPVRDLPPDRALVHLDDRQMGPELRVLEQTRALRAGHGRQVRLPDHGRGEREEQLEGAPEVVTVPEVVVADHVRRHAGEVRASERRGEPLREAAVAAPPHPDLPVAPRLPGHPCEGVVAVLDLGNVRVENALRLETAATILNDERVPALRPPDAVLDEHIPAALVGRPRQDGGERTSGSGQIDVRRKPHPVAHPAPKPMKQPHLPQAVGQVASPSRTGAVRASAREEGSQAPRRPEARTVRGSPSPGPSRWTGRPPPRRSDAGASRRHPDFES